MMAATLAVDLTPDALLGAVAPRLAPRTELHTRTTARGALLVAGSASACGSWLVLGNPVVDPWGIPGRDLELAEVAADLARWGSAAIQLYAGPVVAFEVDRHAAVRAVNGLIPLFVGEAPWVVSTERKVVEQLTGGGAKLVPPGHEVSVAGGTVDVGDAYVNDELPIPSPGALAAELRARVAHLDHMRPHDVAAVDVCGGRWTARIHEVAGTNDMLWLPDLHTIGGRAGIERARGQLAPGLWRQLDVAGRRLLAPCLERPALDLVTQGGAGP